MPMGAGTYGSKRGRPPKKKNGMTMNGKKKNGAKKMMAMNKKRMMRKA